MTSVEHRPKVSGMTDSDDNTVPDRSLWQIFVESVTPLDNDDQEAQPKLSSSSVKPDTSALPPENKNSDDPPQIKQKDHKQHRVMPIKMDRHSYRQIARGKHSIDRTIDLHHMTRDQARRALENFIRDCRRHGDKRVLVITGKGDPARGTGVIRKEFPLWLESTPFASWVHMWHAAARHDGGQGAFYLILRRKR